MNAQSEMQARPIGIGVILACLVLLLLLLALGFYAHPTSDDFDYAYVAREQGILGGVIHFYQNWSGRYASAAITLAFGRWVDLTQSYWMVTAASLLTLYAAFLYSFRALCRVLGIGRPLVLGHLAFLFYMLFVPRLDTAFYWLAGAATYQPGNALFLVFAGVWADYFRGPASRARDLRFGLILAVVAALIAGMNETIMLVTVGLSALMALVVLRLRGRRIGVWLPPLIVIAVLGAMAAFAPGHDVRLGIIGEVGNESLGRSLLISVFHALVTALKLVVSALAFLQIGFIRTLLAEGLARFDGILGRLSTAERSLLALAFIGLLVLLFFPAAWAKGAEAPGRVQSVSVLLGTLALIPTMAALRRAFGDHLYPSRIAMRRLVSTGSLIALLAVSNLPKLARDIPRVQTFHAEKMARYALIREAQTRGMTELSLPPLRTRMKVLYSKDLKPYERREENRLFGAYFGWHHPIWAESLP
ncbi:DUF6056 family protein [Thiocapsa bogorovii]|uniref:DUF6056 family protein n=1 Tax=Thiocapsa bogorovii TaxID=521689 RepID=UPI001E529419|nr:DUF6056 family protein [Thiocapsa bogorovii]UHD15863.1 DUF6056 family protein [Thiocapsa bogorovii]